MSQSHDHGSGAGSSAGGHRAAAPSAAELRAKALESVLVDKGLVSAAAIDAVVDVFENEVGPRNGAKIVARAWSDDDYRKRLLSDATAAAGELGFGGVEGDYLVAVENTPAVHNVVVCTLCSCYPWPILGIPPVWYKSAPYRARVVREPRKVLREEFALELSDEVEIRVWDSSADVRYIVLPRRPDGTGDLSEEQLAGLVTRDSMIGVGLPGRSS